MKEQHVAVLQTIAKGRHDSLSRNSIIKALKAAGATVFKSPSRGDLCVTFKEQVINLAGREIMLRRENSRGEIHGWLSDMAKNLLEKNGLSV